MRKVGKSMVLTFGQLAGLIAAGAFLILVIALCFVLKGLIKTLEETTKSIGAVTEDINGISKELEQLVNKTNTLMDDVNQKSAKLDPLFETMAELSESVSDLNAASRNMAERVSGSAKAATQVSMAFRLGKQALKFYNKHKKNPTD